MRTQNVKDLLTKHQKPEVVVASKKLAIPSGVSTLKCIDAVGCRLNALVKRSRGLPVFSPLDEWEPFSLAGLAAADYVYIKVEGRLHEGLFPYTGARPYAAEVCEYMLDQKIVNVEHCKAMISATRHVPAELLAKNLDVLKDAFGTGLWKTGANSDSYIKGAFLSAFGLWNATKQFSYKQYQGFYEVDAGVGVKMRRRMDDGSFIFTSSTELVGLYSMAPWGRIALDVEQMRVAQAIAFVKQFPLQLSTVGAHVDGVFVFSHDFDQQRIHP